MCGIAGWYAWGNERPPVNVVKGLLFANMERGTSATGMAWQHGDSIICRKGKGPASEFITNTPDDLFEQVALSSRAILHARATTKGSEDKNENNHPVIGGGWLVVHNGTISNDDDLWSYYTEKHGAWRFAEVDTSVIPLMLSRGRTLDESIPKLTALAGSATIAAWSETDQDRILLGRLGNNELHMFYDAPGNILYWSSAPSAGYVMRGTFVGKHKFLNMSGLADQHVLVLTPEGIDSTRVFKLTQRPFFVARKVVKSKNGGTTTGSTAGYIPATHPLVPLQRGRLAIQDTSSASSQALIPGLKEVLSNERQSELTVEPNYIKVVFKAPTDALMLAVTWKPIEPEAGKPKPTSDIFGRVWWNFVDIFGALARNPVVTEVTKESGYGRWTFGKKSDGETYLKFRGHKRVKSWWDRLYRTWWEFPLEIGNDGRTELCDHMCWEHYDVHLQTKDKATTSFLGFMCPWCGVWMSSTRVQEMKFRCDFCCIRSRTQPAQGGEGG